MKSNTKLFRPFQTAISFQSLTISTIPNTLEVCSSSIAEDKSIWPLSGSTKKIMSSATSLILTDLITTKMLLMIARRFLSCMMDVKVLRSAQQKKMKPFTINLKKTSVQMKNQMNMDPTFQTWARLNKNWKNWNKVKTAKRTQRKMMTKMKKLTRTATELRILRKLDRKDKLSQELLTTESSRDKRCTSFQSITKVRTMVKVPVLFFINSLPNLIKSIKIIFGTGLSESATTKSMVRLLNLKSKKK